MKERHEFKSLYKVFSVIYRVYTYKGKCKFEVILRCVDYLDTFRRICCLAVADDPMKLLFYFIHTRTC